MITLMFRTQIMVTIISITTDYNHFISRTVIFQKNKHCLEYTQEARGSESNNMRRTPQILFYLSF